MITIGERDSVNFTIIISSSSTLIATSIAVIIYDYNTYKVARIRTTTTIYSAARDRNVK